MRKLAAIMFTDLVGYSALSQKNEALALELLKEHQELLRPLFAQHNGTEIKTIGDAFLVEFASAVEAARCAVDIQKALTAHTSVVAPERRIQVRIGLHVGDVVYEEGDVLGDGVNIASRIEPLAPPGGICVSEDVAHQIENKIDLPLELLGEKLLKGIQKPVMVYRILLPWEKEAGLLRLVRVALRKPLRARWVQAGVIVLLIAAGVGWWWTSQRVPSIRPGEITRLAVLPFANLMNDPQQDYFVDGMHDALLTELSKLAALTVISRQSVMRYKGSDKSLGDIARELQAHALIEGSVLRAGDDVRINVQLIEAAADRHLWADIFDRKLEDVLALHSDVAQAIASEVKITLTPEEESRLANARQVDPDAYQLYLKGVYNLQESWTADELWEAISYFQQAIEIDSTYAPAYAGLADGYNNLSVFTFLSPKEAYPKAKAAVLKALELDNTLGEACASLGYFNFVFDWDWQAADEAFRRAIELRPSNVGAHTWLSWYLTLVGRADEGIAVARRSIELNPLSPSCQLMLGQGYFMARRYDEAIGELKKVLEMAPNNPFAHMELAWSYAKKGMPTEAIAECEKALASPASTGNPMSLGTLGWVYGLSDRSDKARELLGQLTAQSAQRWIDPLWTAAIYLGLGDKDGAFQWLEKGYHERSPAMVYIKTPHLESLTDDPRYTDLLLRMNFPE